MAWLNYEILAFYLNMLAMAMFLLISSCKKFTSIRDRRGLGLGLDVTKKMDFLTYCKNDIHWFCLWFTQVMLSVLAFVKSEKELAASDWTIVLFAIIFLLEIIVLFSLYFSQNEFEVKSYHKGIFGGILVLNLVLIWPYTKLEEEDAIWWAPMVLQYIVMHMYIFLQLGIEWAQWKKQET